MPSSLESSRLARYSLVATAAAVGSGGAAVADVTSGSFDFSFGRTAGTAFFNGMSASSGTYFRYGYGSAGMGDLDFYFTAFVGRDYANAFSRFGVGSANSGYGYFNQLYSPPTGTGTRLQAVNWVDAGAFWQTTGSSTESVVNAIFWTYDSGGETQTWTNEGLSGTRFVNFKFEGLDGAGRKYGWIQFDWNITDANDWAVSVSNWAYSDDGPLAAGSTGVPAVPGLGGLAALAVGAAGVRGRRQRAAG